MAASNDGYAIGLMICGALVGGVFVWICYNYKQLQSNTIYPNHDFTRSYWRMEFFRNARTYSPKEANRIACHSSDIVVNGKWYGKIVSLWKTYNGEFFIITISEIDVPDFKLVDEAVAEKFIRRCCHSQEAARILSDWFPKPVKTEQELMTAIKRVK